MRHGEGLRIRCFVRQGRTSLAKCPWEVTSVMVNSFDHLCVICNALAASVQSQSFEIELLNHFKLWNLKKIYGRRTYDPEKLSNEAAGVEQEEEE